jgi:hypothetical protein
MFLVVEVEDSSAAATVAMPPAGKAKAVLRQGSRKTETLARMAAKFGFGLSLVSLVA